jgi:hypothetical protein
MTPPRAAIETGEAGQSQQKRLKRDKALVNDYSGTNSGGGP